MIIDKDFIGGNIRLVGIDGDVVTIERELRDSTDWFYWAFRVRGAAGKTVTFRFPCDVRVGYWGAAVSNDLQSWRWTGAREVNGGSESFTYTFGKDENETYFAHNILYSPAQFERFAKEKGLCVQTFCKSQKGRDLPYIRFGNGEKKILLTSRHHACENSGTYVLEGVLSSLLENPIENCEIVCVPFVDYDGVVDGDQGKNRMPHDHNRDYCFNFQPIYEVCAAIRDFIERNQIVAAFDFHSPWHISGENDKVYIVYGSPEMMDELQAFGKTFEGCITADSLQYETKNDHLPDVGWNRSDSPTCTRYAAKKPECKISFSLETSYFGEAGNQVTQEKMLALGKCFAEAMRKTLA